MAQAALTERQQRERKYYDHFVARGGVDWLAGGRSG